MEHIETVNGSRSQSMLDELRSMNAVNVMPALPPSPRVRSRKNGQVFIWSEAFARRPELFRNCDEHGNTDPSTWQGRFPDHYSQQELGEYMGVPARPVRETPSEGPLRGIIVGVPDPPS
jgi:hypothetical protein